MMKGVKKTWEEGIVLAFTIVTHSALVSTSSEALSYTPYQTIFTIGEMPKEVELKPLKAFRNPYQLLLILFRKYIYIITEDRET